MINSSLTAGHNGQACFWFSNGCSIGCEECDGTTRGPSIHTNKTDICGKGYKATVCDPKLRTVNTGAECGSEEDSYYYSPWRAPGSAPLFDSCGMAGGTPHKGGFGAQYRNSSHARQGDRGSQTLDFGVAGRNYVDLRQTTNIILRFRHMDSRIQGQCVLVDHSQSWRRIPVQTVS